MLFFKKHKELAYAILLLAIGLYISYFQIFGIDLKYIIGDLGDSRFISSIIEYNYQWLIGNYDNYWDGFFMYPDKEVISYSDNLLGITPFYAFFRLFGINHLTSYQLIILLCHVLNYFASYYCFYKLTGNKYAAAIGAFVFAFNLSLNSIHNHPQFTFRFCVPLALYHLFAYLNSFKIKQFILFGFWLAFQFYLGIYLGYFLLLFSLVFFLFYLLSKKENIRSFFTLRNIALVLLASIGFILSVLPIFYYYYKRNQITGYYTNYEEILETVPHFKSYLFPFYSSYTYPFLSTITIDSKYPWFHQLFPGIIVYFFILLSIWISIRKKDKTIVSLLLTLCFFLVFAINVNGSSLYQYLQDIPGLKAIRVVSRFVLISTFFYAWIIVQNISYFKVKSKFMRIAIILIFPVFLFFDNYCTADGFKRYEKQEAFSRIKAIEKKILQVKPTNSNLVFAYLPKTDEEAYKIQIDAMQTAVYMKGKTINGYSSSCHGNFGPFWNYHDSLSLKEWCKVFNLNEKDIVVIH